MSSDDEIREAQARSLPKQDLSPYAGQWVALREGIVVASGPDPVALRGRHEVEPTDMLMPVPLGGADTSIV